MATVITQSYMLLSEEKKESKDVTQSSRPVLRNSKIQMCNGVITNNGQHKINPDILLTNHQPENGRITFKEEDNFVKVSHSSNIDNPPEVTDETVSETPDTDVMKKELPVQMGQQEYEWKMKWTNLIAITILHTLGVYGFFHMAWNFSLPTVLFSTLFGIMAGFGVTGGAHRYWTHRSYKAKAPLQYILLFCYTIAGQNTLYEWVRDHRVHHKYSETDADPHNSNRGFFFSHVGWLFIRKHPEVIEKGSKMDLTDITSDPLLEWHRRNFVWLRPLICIVLPTVIPMYFWNETFKYAFFSNMVRYTMTLNATWSVNSFAHIWGYKPYDRRIQPVENVGVAVFSLGEGWHNYHHAFPWDYRASEIGYRYNLTAFLIDQFAKIGWAYDLKKPSETLVAKMVEKYGEDTRYNEWATSEAIDKDS